MQSVSRRAAFLALMSVGAAQVALAQSARHTLPGPAASLAVAAAFVSPPPAGAHGFAFGASSLDLAVSGYVENEFLISGNARAFASIGALGADGRWSVAPAAGRIAPFTTRILVRRPADPARFNGTVLVEWLNVTSGVDLAPDWLFAREQLMRDGYAWVGVSAQYDGARALKGWDNARYAAIVHPGDSYSYDIFSAAAASLRAPQSGGLSALGPLQPSLKIILATGESQSALRMMTYANAIQPIAQAFDGIMIHSGGFAENLSQSTASRAVTTNPAGIMAMADVSPPVAQVRTDLSQPVLFLNTETDVAVLGAAYSVHQQPDSADFRVWELAGTSHADAYVLAAGQADLAKSGIAASLDCGALPANTGPGRYGVRSAISALNGWVATGIAPRSQPRISSWGPVFGLYGVNRDANGNVLGGIRMPQIAVPTATESGLRPSNAMPNPACLLVGSSQDWAASVRPNTLAPSGVTPILRALYPDHQTYVVDMIMAASAQINSGALLMPDAAQIVMAAAAAAVP